MARIVDGPPPRRRKTEHPYTAWICGEWIELQQGEDFHKSPKTVANAFNAYCKRHGFAGKAIARRDEEHGDLLRLVFVWADRNRPGDLGLPEDVEAQIALSA